VLLPNFAISVHATQTCVCNTAHGVPVSHTIHTNCESKTVDSLVMRKKRRRILPFVPSEDAS
jgi:hypothetical protein